MTTDDGEVGVGRSAGVNGIPSHPVVLPLNFNSAPASLPPSPCLSNRPIRSMAAPTAVVLSTSLLLGRSNPLTAPSIPSSLSVLMATNGRHLYWLLTQVVGFRQQCLVVGPLWHIDNRARGGWLRLRKCNLRTLGRLVSVYHLILEPEMSFSTLPVCSISPYSSILCVLNHVYSCTMCRFWGKF